MRQGHAKRASLSSRFGEIRLILTVAVMAAALLYQYGNPFQGMERPDAVDRSTVTASLDRSFSMCGSMPRRDCVVDGDTFYYGGQKVRIADIDAPEVFSPHCRAERELGDRATRRLYALLNEGQLKLHSIERERDRYGRLLRIVERDGRSLGATLVNEGLAKEWNGPRRNWCG